MNVCAYVRYESVSLMGLTSDFGGRFSVTRVLICLSWRVTVHVQVKIYEACVMFWVLLWVLFWVLFCVLVSVLVSVLFMFCYVTGVPQDYFCILFPTSLIRELATLISVIVYLSLVCVNQTHHSMSLYQINNNLFISATSLYGTLLIDGKLTFLRNWYIRINWNDIMFNLL